MYGCEKGSNDGEYQMMKKATTLSDSEGVAVVYWHVLSSD
jgi:hypothetical protein